MIAMTALDALVLPICLAVPLGLALGGVSNWVIGLLDAS